MGAGFASHCDIKLWQAKLALPLFDKEPVWLRLQQPHRHQLKHLSVEATEVASTVLDNTHLLTHVP